MKSENRHWVWRCLHLALTLSLPFALAFMLGCKKAKEEKADLGAEVDPALIDEALAKAVTGASTSGTRVNEYVNFAVVRRIENEDATTLIGATNVKVFAYDQANSRYALQITKSYLQSDGSFQNVTTEDYLPVTAPSMLQLNPNPEAPTTSKLEAESKEHVHEMTGSTVEKVTYHNLRVTTGTYDVPDKIRLKTDCGGLSPCEIPVTYIQFDMASWTSDTDYQKMSLDFAFATKTPYLPFGEGFDQLNGLMVADCRSLYVDIGTRNVYVRDCQLLDDLQK